MDSQIELRASWSIGKCLPIVFTTTAMNNHELEKRSCWPTKSTSLQDSVDHELACSLALRCFKCPVVDNVDVARAYFFIVHASSLHVLVSHTTEYSSAVHTIVGGGCCWSWMFPVVSCFMINMHSPKRTRPPSPPSENFNRIIRILLPPPWWSPTKLLGTPPT